MSDLPWNASGIEEITVLTHVQGKSLVPVCSVPGQGLWQHSEKQQQQIYISAHE